MGDGVRERIWRYLDDPDFAAHESLRNALYRLLVAVEIPGSLRPSTVDATTCLDVAAAAVRANDGALVARACALVDDVVARLATAPRGRRETCETGEACEAGAWN